MSMTSLECNRIKFRDEQILFFLEKTKRGEKIYKGNRIPLVKLLSISVDGKSNERVANNQIKKSPKLKEIILTYNFTTGYNFLGTEQISQS